MKARYSSGFFFNDIHYMPGKYFILSVLLIAAASLHGQTSPSLAEMNKNLPHHFKEIRIGATLEAVRDHNMVRLYMLIDEIHQYDEVSVERSDEFGQNFAQCKVVEVTKEKYKNNYLELDDDYPQSAKMSVQYRIKTVTSEGITRMYPPVSAAFIDDPKMQK